METIAVIGAGPVGGTLAAALANAGHQVVVGSRIRDRRRRPAFRVLTDSGSI